MLSIREYLLRHCFSFASSAAFLLRSFSAFLAGCSAASTKTGYWGGFGHLRPNCKPPLLPRVLLQTSSPCSDTPREPLWERLMTFPLSNLDLMCIQHSARFVVTLPSSCLAFATSLLRMSCIIFGLISAGVCPPHWKFLSVVGSSVTVLSTVSFGWYLPLKVVSKCTSTYE